MKLGLKFGLEMLTKENMQFAQQMGVEHVLVNGTFVVRNGENVEGIRPGRPVLGKMYGGE